MTIFPKFSSLFSTPTHKQLRQYEIFDDYQEKRMTTKLTYRVRAQRKGVRGSVC
jgi:hypothetical protein